MLYSNWRLASKGGASHVRDCHKILVPIFVGIVLKLVTIWLENRTRNKQVASSRCCLNSKKTPYY
ncbi:type I toxin-antitoxin system Fst family toxin [Enterococcus faecalis]|uniref:type I toxin-antitoxin system Fst family toxin n=1 Tax=Enterococcus faecalis TaxID=1351 RepID=UPI003977CF76